MWGARDIDKRLWYLSYKAGRKGLRMSVLSHSMKRCTSYCSICKCDGRLIKRPNSKLKESCKVHLNEESLIKAYEHLYQSENRNITLLTHVIVGHDLFC